MAVVPTFEELTEAKPAVPSFEALTGTPTVGPGLRETLDEALFDRAANLMSVSDRTGVSLEQARRIEKQVNHLTKFWFFGKSPQPKPISQTPTFWEAMFRSGIGLGGGTFTMLAPAEQRAVVVDVANAVAETPRDVYIGGMRFSEGIFNAMQWFDDLIVATGTRPSEEELQKTLPLYQKREGEVAQPDDIADWFATKADSAASVQHAVTLENAPFTRIARSVIQNGVPSLGVSLGMTALTGSPVAGLAVFFASEGGSSYREQKEAGASLGKASLIATLSGTAEVAGEMLVFPRFVKGMTKGIPFREAVALVSENATQEGATGFTQEFLRTFGLLTTQGMSTKEALPKAFDAGVAAIPENAFVGAATAGLADVALGAFGRIEPIQMGPTVQSFRQAAAPGTSSSSTPPEAVSTPSANPSAVDLLAQQIVKARKVAPKIRQEQRAERSQRVGAMAGTVDSLIASGMAPGEALDRASGQLAGPLTQYQARYESIRDQLGPQTIHDLQMQIATDAKLKPFEKLVLGGEQQGLLTRLIDGDALTLHEARLLGDYFGRGIGTAAMGRVPYGEKFWNTVLEALNLPRTALASLDVSGIMRQGRALMEAYPEMAPEFVENYGKAFASEEFAVALEDSYKNDARYDEAKEAGLEMPEWGRVDVNINELAEQFAGARFLQKIPGIRASERSFVTALNSFRFAVFNQVVEQTETNRGRPMEDVEKQRLASRINNLTGRTSLPAGLQQLSPILNAAFFSPRFALSRLAPLRDIPMSALYSIADVAPEGPGGSPTIKRWRLEMQPELPIAMKAMAKMMATNITIMGLLKWLWGDDKDLKLETDPRSSDWGKIRYKDQRIDLWAGYVQAARFMARMATGETKTAAGEIREIDRGKLFRQFIRSKQSPLASMFLDWWEGQNMIGKPFGEPAKGGMLERNNIPGGGVMQEAWDRLAPLVIQDTVDALTIGGVPEAIIGGSLSFLGVGEQTYEPSGFTIAKQQKNDLAQAKYQQPWDELKPSQQKWLRSHNPQIAESERSAKGEAYPIRKEDNAEEVKVATRVRERLTENVQKALNETQVSTGVPRTIMGDFWLNQTRFRKYQELAGIEIQKRVEHRIGMKSWGNMTPNAQAEVLKREVDAARAVARNRLVRMIEGGSL